MSEDRAKQLALIYQAISDCEEDRSEAAADFKARLETLYKEANKLRFEILTGQLAIPLGDIIISPALAEKVKAAHDIAVKKNGV